MAHTVSNGQCAYCQRTFAKSGMTRHLQACRPRQETLQGSRGTSRLFHLVVEGSHLPVYWMHLELPASATLDELDSFLRRVWLECCGHLSAFEIDGTSFTGYVDGGLMFRERSMYGVKLSRVVRQGQRFSHEYDFGSTTDLTLRVVDERKGAIGDERIRTMARNDSPSIPCGICGQPAVRVCPMCAWQETGWVCAKCARRHPCGNDYLLPIVNSPRTGVCGYTGD